MGFKDRLREKRVEANLTQAALAEKVSVTARTIQNYELGSRKPTKYEVVKKIAEALNTTPEYLLGNSGMLVLAAQEQGGAKAAREIDELVSEVSGMFAGGSLSEDALGINVMDDCENLGSLKGMYCIVKRNRFIFLNKDLSPQMKRIVCAHEIGHDRLHRALAKKHGLQEFVLYDMATKPEYEANIVAAEILLDSDEILEYIYDYGYTSEQIARAMHTDINLVALKIAHLAETGHKLRRMEYRSSFLK